jgi:hypothetical protein
MFAIYIPGRGGEATKRLASVGAAWALDDGVTAAQTDIFQDGPDGGGGALIYFERGAGDRSALSRYAPAAQTWEPAAPAGELAGGRFWLGVWNERKPGPDDLQRKTVCDGLPVQLLDGREWLIAVAEYLPKRMRLDRATGAQKLEALPADMPFIDKTNAMFTYLVSDEFQSPLDALGKVFQVVIPQGLTYAAEALAKNYRVNVDLVDMLGLIGEFEAVKIAAVATGLELIATEGEQKKSALLAATSCED